MVVGSRDELEIDTWQALPALSITTVGANAVISWPSWATNFSLETSGTPQTTVSWISVTNNVVAIGDRVFLTNDPGTGAGFYRLRN